MLCLDRGSRFGLAVGVDRGGTVWCRGIALCRLAGTPAVAIARDKDGLASYAGSAGACNRCAVSYELAEPQ